LFLSKFIIFVAQGGGMVDAQLKIEDLAMLVSG